MGARVLSEETDWQRRDAGGIRWFFAGACAFGLLVSAFLGAAGSGRAWWYAVGFIVAGLALLVSGQRRRTLPAIVSQVDDGRLVTTGAGIEQSVPLDRIHHAALVSVGGGSWRAGYVDVKGRYHLIRTSAASTDGAQLVDALQTSLGPRTYYPTLSYYPQPPLRLLSLVMWAVSPLILVLAFDREGLWFALFFLVCALLGLPATFTRVVLEVKDGRLVRRYPFGAVRSIALSAIKEVDVGLGMWGRVLDIRLKDGRRRRFKATQVDDKPLEGWLASLRAELAANHPAAP